LGDRVAVEQINYVGVRGNNGKGVTLLLHEGLDQAEVLIDVEGEDLEIWATLGLIVEFL
jgi:hypothetical protein